MIYDSFDDEKLIRAINEMRDFAGKVTFPALCSVIESQKYDIISIVKHPVFDAYDVVLRYKKPT